MEAFWTALLGAVAGGGILAFVVRSLFKQVLSRDLETFKAGLQRENARAIAEVQAELREAGFRQERLHELRLDLLSDLYHRLYDAIQALDRALYTNDEPAGAIRAAAAGLDHLHRGVVKSLPFIGQDLASRMKQVNRQLRTIYMRVDSDGGARGEKWREAVVLLQEDLSPLLDEFADRLRVFVEGPPSQ